MSKVATKLRTRLEWLQTTLKRGVEFIDRKTRSEEDEKVTPLRWIDDPKPDANDGGHMRRFWYFENRIQESLSHLQELHQSSTSEQRPPDSPTLEKIIQIRERCSNAVNKWEASNSKIREYKTELDLADVVRRLRDNSELSPCILNNLDRELFAPCFILETHKKKLRADEQTMLRRRIQKEVSSYLREGKDYNDLSVIWWGVASLTDWQELPEQERIALVREVANLTDPEKIEISYEVFLAHEAEIIKSFERNGDLMTARRSLVLCHKCAIKVRKWVQSLRKPQLSPLITKLRRWSDACADYWMDPTVASPTHLQDVYRWTWELSFCAQWWEDRGARWSDAIKIIENGVDKDWNKSKTPGIATANKNFADELREDAESVKKFRSEPPQTKPYVVGLFGPPGTGKSHVARKLVGKAPFFEVNLSTLQSPEELFSTLSTKLKLGRLKQRKRLVSAPVVFLDEFDATLRGGYWYGWLLSMLWDGKILVTKMGQPSERTLPATTVIFLAASRYETQADFRDFALSPGAEAHKASDLFTRIDLQISLPRLGPRDRVVMMYEQKKCKHKKEGRCGAYKKCVKFSGGGRPRCCASNEILALCYLAELDDNARGIAKLLKGTRGNERIMLDDLIPATQNLLLNAAGLGEPRAHAQRFARP